MLMPTNLVSLIMQFLTPDVINRIASAVGLDRNTTDQASSALVPAMLGGLTKLAGTSDGARRLFDVVSKQPPGLLDSMAGMIGGSGQKTLMENGLSMVSSLLGGSATQTLASAVSRFSGADQSSASSLLGLLAPMVTGALARETASNGLDASGLAQMLNGQKANIQAALPSGFADLLKGTGVIGDMAGQTARAATTAATSAGVMAQRAAQGSAAAAGSSMRWTYWAIPALAVLAAAWWLMGNRTERVAEQRPAAPPVTTTAPPATTTAPSRETTGSVPSTADDLRTRTTQALAALTSAPGGTEIANQTTSALDVVKATLSQVTDAASAQTALPKLQDALGQMDKVRGMATNLPTGGRTALANLIALNMPAINAQLDKVLAIPGVAAILKQPIDALRTDLDTLARAPA
jgi:Bacterial protein of unknown function (DUF937)